jgi:hypothetical protein
MKFKSLVTFSFFFGFLLIGLFLPTSRALGAVEFVCFCSGSDTPHVINSGEFSGCCAKCGANVCSGTEFTVKGGYLPSMSAFTDTNCSTTYATRDCSSTTTPSSSSAQSIQCATVNPECTTAWDSGEKTSRFISTRDCYCCGDCGFNDIVNIFINAADYLFGILGALALLFFIYGGLVWLTSGGSAGQVDKGKKILLGAVIGMLLALGAWLIVKFLVTALGVTAPVTGF